MPPAPGASFRYFVEQEIGKFPHFVLYALLEWTLIGILFLDGFIAFAASEFAKFFDLEPPCLLCTRIDHIFACRTSSSGYICYNQSICEFHKRDMSSLAFCDLHRRLSDLQRMCERCLLSFSTAADAAAANSKAKTAQIKKDLEGFFDDEIRARVRIQSAVGQGVVGKNGNVCSCCGEPMKVKPVTSNLVNQNKGVNWVARGLVLSPREVSASGKVEEARVGLEVAHIRSSELKLSACSSEDEDGGNVAMSGKEDAKVAGAPLQSESEELIDDDLAGTPTFARGNRFFSVPLSDSAASSPRWASRIPRKLMLDRMELSSDPVEAIAGNETDTETIMNRLKRRVRLDRKTLIALYVELNEERSASAVAANNAMAMITRLQAEKAAVQMEALQYQRMMEEQAQYDQEALQAANELLTKREEEIKELEAELDLYRERYEMANEVAIISEVDPMEVNSFSSFNERSECGSPLFGLAAMDVDMVQEQALEKVRSLNGEGVNSFSSITERSEHESALFRLNATGTEMDHEHASEKVRSERSEHGSPHFSLNAMDSDTEHQHDSEKAESLRREGGRKFDDGLSIDIDGERSCLLSQLRMLVSRIQQSSAPPNGISMGSQEDDKGGSNTVSAEELSQLGEKLKAIEPDSRFLKNALLTLQKGGSEGSELLTEISRHLQKLQQMENLPSEPAASVST